MEGENCSMENLGTAADITSGSVEIVDPLNLKETVVSLLSKKILASNATCTLFIPNTLHFRSEEKHVLNKVEREISNITEETDLTFSFEWEDSAREKFKTGFGKVFFPFQVQFTYLKQNGDKCLKVLSRLLPVTKVREEVERDLNSAVIALRAIQQAAKMAQWGNYNDARISLTSVQRLLQRSMKTKSHQRDYLSYIVQSEKLDQFMRESQQQDSIFGMKDGTIRQRNRDDDSSKAMYQMKSVSLKKFNERN